MADDLYAITALGEQFGSGDAFVHEGDFCGGAAVADCMGEGVLVKEQNLSSLLTLMICPANRPRTRWSRSQ